MRCETTISAVGSSKRGFRNFPHFKVTIVPGLYTRLLLNTLKTSTMTFGETSMTSVVPILMYLYQGGMYTCEAHTVLSSLSPVVTLISLGNYTLKTDRF
jgi:hypothetical protein